MPERRPTNSELRLQRLVSDEQDPAERGILELFDEVADPSDEDAPLTRDADDSEL
jgi:hypothetical protein